MKGWESEGRVRGERGKIEGRVRGDGEGLQTSRNRIAREEGGKAGRG